MPIPKSSRRRPDRPRGATQSVTTIARTLELGADPLPSVAIRSPGTHPFIYRKMIEGPVGDARPEPGDLVRVVHRDGGHVGFGLWNPRSQITLRMLSWSNDPPDMPFWRARIENALRLRHETLHIDKTSNAYRLFHAEADGLSGLIVDRLNDVLSVECFSIGIYQRMNALIELIRERIQVQHHRVHVDERVAMGEDFAGRPIASPGLPPAVTIEEHGIRYRIRFEGSHKTGFFCDQRDNRYQLAEFCGGRDVLDVCCYTGGFGLNARIRGDAKEVLCVDLDEQALALARENAHLNQVRLTFAQSDAFGYMRQLGVNGRKFGAIVLDPPKLIPSRDEVSLGKRKYFDMNLLAMNLLEPGGIFLTCSCSGLLPQDDFLGILRAVARQTGRHARILRINGAAPDHPVSIDVPESGYLKAVWMMVD